MIAPHWKSLSGNFKDEEIFDVFTSVADPGCLSRIPDLIFSIQDPGRFRIPDPHQRFLSIFNQKTVSNIFKNDPRCSSRIPAP
jgi:hypothetical protein